MEIVTQDSDSDPYMTSAATQVAVEEYMASFYDDVSDERRAEAQAAWDAHLQTLSEEDQVTAACNVMGLLYEATTRAKP